MIYTEIAYCPKCSKILCFSFQANSYVDMSGIRMRTVAVRSEELEDSGRDLLLWVEYYLGPVAMYASMNNSNKIQITLPQTGELIQACKYNYSDVL